MGKLKELTDREFQILSLLAEGHKDLNIASALAIDLETVKSHNKNIFRKLCVRNRAEAVLHLMNSQSNNTENT